MTSNSVLSREFLFSNSRRLLPVVVHRTRGRSFFGGEESITSSFLVYSSISISNDFFRRRSFSYLGERFTYFHLYLSYERYICAKNLRRNISYVRDLAVLTGEPLTFCFRACDRLECFDGEIYF